MLTPYICAVCEKVIIAKDDVVSLISIFSKMILSPINNKEIPKEAVVPKEWAIFGIWTADENLSGKEIFACTKVLYPDGSQFGQIAKQPIITVPTTVYINRLQALFQLTGFPIGQEGFYEAHLWLEDTHQSTICEAQVIKLQVEFGKANEEKQKTPSGN